MQSRWSLAGVFRIKIALTLILWACPLVLFPEPVFAWIGFPSPVSVLFLRLLGVAYLALILGYALGLRELSAGGRATSAKWTGIASNGAACVVLLVYGLNGGWADWGLLAKIYLWFSVVATAMLTLALAISPIRQGK